MSLNEDGFDGPVDRKGHGLQRAFILTLLQHLAKATAASEDARQAGEEPTDGVEAADTVALGGAD